MTDIKLLKMDKCAENFFRSLNAKTIEDVKKILEYRHSLYKVPIIYVIEAQRKLNILQNVV